LVGIIRAFGRIYRMQSAKLSRQPSRQLRARSASARLLSADSRPTGEKMHDLTLMSVVNDFGNREASEQRDSRRIWFGI